MQAYPSSLQAEQNIANRNIKVQKQQCYLDYIDQDCNMSQYETKENKSQPIINNHSMKQLFEPVDNQIKLFNNNNQIHPTNVRYPYNYSYNCISRNSKTHNTSKIITHQLSNNRLKQLTSNQQYKRAQRQPTTNNNKKTPVGVTITSNSNVNHIDTNLQIPHDNSSVINKNNNLNPQNQTSMMGKQNNSALMAKQIKVYKQRIKSLEFRLIDKNNMLKQRERQIEEMAHQIDKFNKQMINGNQIDSVDNGIRQAPNNINWFTLTKQNQKNDILLIQNKPKYIQHTTQSTQTQHLPIQSQQPVPSQLLKKNLALTQTIIQLRSQVQKYRKKYLVLQQNNKKRSSQFDGKVDLIAKKLKQQRQLCDRLKSQKFSLQEQNIYLKQQNAQLRQRLQYYEQMQLQCNQADNDTQHLKKGGIKICSQQLVKNQHDKHHGNDNNGMNNDNSRNIVKKGCRYSFGNQQQHEVQQYFAEEQQLSNTVNKGLEIFKESLYMNMCQKNTFTNVNQNSINPKKDQKHGFQKKVDRLKLQSQILNINIRQQSQTKAKVQNIQQKDSQPELLGLKRNYSYKDNLKLIRQEINQSKDKKITGRGDIIKKTECNYDRDQQCDENAGLKHDYQNNYHTLVQKSYEEFMKRRGDNNQFTVDKTNRYNYSNRIHDNNNGFGCSERNRKQSQNSIIEKDRKIIEKYINKDIEILQKEVPYTHFSCHSSPHNKATKQNQQPYFPLISAKQQSQRLCKPQFGAINHPLSLNRTNLTLNNVFDNKNNMNSISSIDFIKEDARIIGNDVRIVENDFRNRNKIIQRSHSLQDLSLKNGSRYSVLDRVVLEPCYQKNERKNIHINGTTIRNDSLLLKNAVNDKKFGRNSIQINKDSISKNSLSKNTKKNHNIQAIMITNKDQFKILNSSNILSNKNIPLRTSSSTTNISTAGLSIKDLIAQKCKKLTIN